MKNRKLKITVPAQPLTKKQLREFRRNMLRTFDEIYAKTFSSGAMPDNWREKDCHLAAKFAAVKTGQAFNVFDRLSKSEFKNLSHFI